MTQLNNPQGKLGTMPVFVTALCTILGAILFLRFGTSIGDVGFWGILLIILLGHIVTIPTALSISEIATNQKVEGGGVYFMISRSFGLNIGATIGIALYLSQAISIAFYVIACTETFSGVLNTYGIAKQFVSVPLTLLMGALVFYKGSSIGMKALYIVAIMLLVSITLFFMGGTEYGQAGSADYSFSLPAMGVLAVTFGIVFPAFTGMAAGVGMSGDLRNPSYSIPVGTICATVVGMLIYTFVSWKLFASASLVELKAEPLIMTRIAIAGWIVIPMGLVASTLSSALGSILVAPRSLQAIAKDDSFLTPKVNAWLSQGVGETNEPRNASLVTLLIALVFVVMGDIDQVAQIISMFFLITYGAINLISFLNHYGASPSYRPRFRSLPIISLIGFLASGIMMMQMSIMYSLLAIFMMFIIYQIISHVHKGRKGMAQLFKDSFFQLNRRLQVDVQRKKVEEKQVGWRPSVVCVSSTTQVSTKAFDLTSWISYRYGFGTYVHLIKGFFSKETYEDGELMKRKILELTAKKKHYLYIDTLIAPSYTSAIAQIVQMPGVSGMANNMFLFSHQKGCVEEIEQIKDNFNLVKAGGKDVCILGCSERKHMPKQEIHIWLQDWDAKNTNLMILLGFIISSHPSWYRSKIQVFRVGEAGESETLYKELNKLIIAGRLPISNKHVTVLEKTGDTPIKEVMREKSSEAGLVIVGLRDESVKTHLQTSLTGFEGLGDILWVNSRASKIIE